MNTLHLVDASIYVFRAYYSMPPNFYDRDKNLVHAVYGYSSFLLDLLSKNVEHISVAFDESLTTCYRNDIYPDYKANRDLPDENLKYQLKACQEITSLLGLHNVTLKDYEADDIIGTLTHRFSDEFDMVIVTRDKDLGQLLRTQDVLWDFANNDYMGPSDIEEKFGVRPDQLADFLALAGDSVDNIPGAPGIGAKTAAQLIQQFATLDALLTNPSAVLDSGIRGAKRLAKIVSEHADDIRLYRKITGIHLAVPMDVESSQFVPAKTDQAALTDFCDRMAFKGRLRERLIEPTP